MSLPFLNVSRAGVLVLSLLLAGCGSGGTPAPAETPPLEGARIGAPLNLVDQTGKRVNEADFKGKYRMVYFGYTFCPDVCPGDVTNLIGGYRKLEKDDPAKAAKIVPVFITIDPERDTPAVLSQYVKAFHPRLVGLTGTAEEIAAVAKGFAVSYGKVEGSRPDAYLVSHTQNPYLMDPDGKPLALLPFDDPTTEPNEAAPALVAADLAKWVK